MVHIAQECSQSELLRKGGKNNKMGRVRIIKREGKNNKMGGVRIYAPLKKKFSLLSRRFFIEVGTCGHCLRRYVHGDCWHGSRSRRELPEGTKYGSG